MKLKKVKSISKQTLKRRQIYKSNRTKITNPTAFHLQKISKKISNRRRMWKNFEMKHAIEMVKSNELNISMAAARFNIPTSTLSKYLKDNVQIEDDDSKDEQYVESVEELSEIVSDIEIVSSSVSSFNNQFSKDSKQAKVVYMARKSTYPFKVLLKPPMPKLYDHPSNDNFKNFEEQKQINKAKKDEFQNKHHIDTIIDSVLANTYKQKYDILNEFESKCFSKFIL